MLERERDHLLLRLLRERRFVSVRDLTRLLGASEATVRRDLRRLAGAGRLRRVRGGAEAVGSEAAVAPLSLAGQPPFRLDRSRNLPQKRAIARLAVELCEPGDSIIIDGGTTTYAMVEFLRDLELQVLTNSFPVAEYLIHHTHNRVLLPGGEVYREQRVVVSPFEDASIRSFGARWMFMGAQGISPLGLMQTDLLLVQAQKALFERAERLVVLADSSKFSQRGSLVLCPLERIDLLITDEGIDPEAVEMLRAAGVEVRGDGG
jgi:DeoR family ulaG and ulaABCDEF operon transcriptional repressor